MALGLHNCCSARTQHHPFHPAAERVWKQKLLWTGVVLYRSTHEFLSGRMRWLGGGTPKFLDRIIKWFSLEGTLKIILFQPACHGQEPLPLSQVAPSCPWAFPGMGQLLWTICARASWAFLGHCCTGARTHLRPNGSCDWTLTLAKAKAVTFSCRCQNLSSFCWKLSQPSKSQVTDARSAPLTL